MKPHHLLRRSGRARRKSQRGCELSFGRGNPWRRGFGAELRGKRRTAPHSAQCSVRVRTRSRFLQLAPAVSVLRCLLCARVVVPSLSSSSEAIAVCVCGVQRSEWRGWRGATQEARWRRCGRARVEFAARQGRPRIRCVSAVVDGAQCDSSPCHPPSAPSLSVVGGTHAWLAVQMSLPRAAQGQCDSACLSNTVHPSCASIVPGGRVAFGSATALCSAVPATPPPPRARGEAPRDARLHTGGTNSKEHDDAGASRRATCRQIERSTVQRSRARSCSCSSLSVCRSQPQTVRLQYEQTQRAWRSTR